MAKRILAVVVAAALAANAVLSAHGPGANADTPPGVGRCTTDPAPTHEPLVPKTLEVPIPYPAVTAVPVPGPQPAPTRTTQALPPDPCTDPCPDLTAEPPESSLSSELRIPQLRLSPKPFYFNFPLPGPAPGAPPPPRAHPPVDPAPRTAAPPPPRIGPVTEVAKETGKHSINRTDKRWQVHGTDLGIMWESKPGEVAIAFGDTVGRNFHPPGGMGDDWRSNVLAFSTDTRLDDGMDIDRFVVDSRCHAAEVLPSRKLDNIEVTVIPTSGFALGNRQFLSYMSIRTWNSLPGTMFTNHGGIAYSDDGGQTWTKDPYAQWDNIFGLAKFQVVAMVAHGDFVYLFGTPNTRLGDVGLARVPKDQVLNKSAYQYWIDGAWTPVGDAGHAATVIQAPAGELSVRYNAERAVWQMTYLDTSRAAITLRESASPQGTWSEGAPLVSALQYPELYGGFMHPWSRGDELYFMLSTWSDYNVYLMRAKVF